MYPLLKRLNDEWIDLVATSSVLDWSTTCPNLFGCDLDDVISWIAFEPDAALHFLISQAQQGDSLAARTVLQTMLGKLVLVSVQSARPSLTQQAAFVDLTSQMWVTVANYPLADRPNKIAANLWMDCAKQARRLWTSSPHHRSEDRPYSPADVSWLLDHNITPATSADAAGSELRANDVIDTALQLRLITTDTADLLKAVYGPYGLSGEVAAEIWGITPAAVRTRCKRAVRLLADSAHLLFAA